MKKTALSLLPICCLVRTATVEAVRHWIAAVGARNQDPVPNRILLHETIDRGHRPRVSLLRGCPGAERGLPCVQTSEDTDTNQVCVNEGNDPEVDVEYSNNRPYGASLIMFRKGAGPDAALVAFARPE